MVSNSFKKYTKYIYPVILFLLVFYLGVVNYEKGSWLTGWDNTHPEFDFGLNISRSLSVWRENRGLGLPSGMSHPTHFFLGLQWLIFSFILPSSFIRYFWQFLMLFLGPLGVYIFLKEIIFSDDKSTNHFWILSLSFIGALFYLFNLVTVQMFYIPLETFTAHYGFLPWFLFLGISYIRSRKVKYLLFYILICLLSSVQAFTATLFFVFWGFSTFAYFYSAFTEKKAKRVSSAFLVSAITLIVNFYWLLPFIYYLFTHGDFVPNSLINVLASEESYLMNMKYASLKDLVILKNFPFITSDYDLLSSSFLPLMRRWSSFYSENPFIGSLGYFLFAFVVFGVFYSFYTALIKKKVSKVAFFGFLFFFFLLICWFLLWGIHSPLALLFSFLQNTFPSFEEAFRFPFTKVGIFTSFTYSILLTIGIYGLGNIFSKLRKFSIIIPLLLVLWTLPLFKGALFYDGVQVAIPSEYFEMFSWFDEQNSDGRVLPLPIHTHWSWRYNTWGYRGSGFTWFGIKQPLLDRAFDVWSPHNQEAYYQISNAVYSDDYDQFIDTLEKFDVVWLIDDYSIVGADVPQDSPFMGTQYYRKFLQSDAFVLEKDLDFLKVYRFRNVNPGFVRQFGQLPSIAYPLGISQEDLIFEENGNYLKEVSDPSKYYPFATVDDPAKTTEYISDFSSTITLSAPLGDSNELSSLTYEDKLPVELSTSEGQLIIRPLLPRIFVGEDELGFSNAESLMLAAPGVDFLVKINEDILGPVAPQEDKVLGTVYLDSTEAFSLDFYTYTPGSSYDLTSYYQPNSLDVCFDMDQGFYEFYYSDTGFTLGSKGNTACVATSIPADIQGLVSLTIPSEENKARTSFCLYDETLKVGCYNDPPYSDNFFYISNTSREPILQLYSRPIREDTRGEVLFKQVVLNVHSLIEHKELNFPALNLINSEFIKAQTIEVEIPYVKNSEEALFEEFLGSNSQVRVHKCNSVEDLLDSTSFSLDFEKFKSVLRLIGENSQTCLSIEAPDLDHRLGYLFTIDGMRLSGKRQNICVQSHSTYRCDFVYKLKEDRNDSSLSHFILPPMDNDTGYTVIIENISIANEKPQNIYNSVSLIPIPYNFLKSLHLGDNIPVEISPSMAKYHEESLPPHMYRVSTAFLKESDSLVLSQGYDRGWLAFCGPRLCPAQHLKVNNWANGWVFEDSIKRDQIVLFFWPQLLEYIGFALIVGIVLIFLLFEFWGKEVLNTFTKDRT